MRLSALAEERCCGCVSPDATGEDYNLGLHIAAIFIVFGVSITGTLVPIVSTRGPFANQQAIALEWLTSFGFGVVIATGLIHMVGEGIEKLKDPCLGEIVEEYESLGLAIVLGTILLMHLIECESAVFFATNGTGDGGGHGHGHGHGHGNTHGNAHAAMRPMAASSVGHSFFAITPHDPEAAFKSSIVMPLATPQETATLGDRKPAKRKLAAALFEMGVLFHSLVVGIDLGVTSGTDFKTLLTAMCIHQFFEGVALGGSTLGAMETLRQAMAMNTGFAVTTPLGLIVGIAIRASYSETSVAALWVQGVLNCVAGGILLYTGLVELLTYQMTTNGDFLTRTGNQRAMLYVALWLGAGTMALIGKWA